MPRKKANKESSPVKLKEEKVSINGNTVEEKIENKNDIFNQDGELVVDVFETNSEFVVLAAIAGIDIKNLDIAVEKDMMVIKGHRADPYVSANKNYFYKECYWGPFSKKIVLPENIDAKSAEAQINKGILTVKMPKVSKASQEA